MPARSGPARRLCAAALALLAAACGGDARPRLVVFAAASLTAPFEELCLAFAEDEGDAVAVDLHCAGTPQLVLQLREGAPADVFASADLQQMRRVVELGRVGAAPEVFARNELAIVTAKGNPHGIHTLADFAAHDGRVLLCAPEVPAGRYAREVLEKKGLSVRSASDEPSVLAVVNKLRLGLVDVAIVYRTDHARAPDELELVEIPAADNVAAEYPIAVLEGAEAPAPAARFVAFVTGPRGRAVLHRHGFATP